VSELQSNERFPRVALLAAAGLIVSSLVLVGASRLSGVGVMENPTSVPVQQRALHFEDREDGGVAVYAEGPDGKLVEVLEPGTNGFVRSVIRGLVRERRREGLGREPGFRLTRWADGRISLDDLATGRRVELDAFGPTNAGAFADLLLAEVSSR